MPRCGPGPFSMANADTVTDVLVHAGFESIGLARQDLPIRIGNNLEHAVAFNMALGPAAEVLRMWGSRVDEIRPKIAADLSRPSRTSSSTAAPWSPRRRPGPSARERRASGAPGAAPRVRVGEPPRAELRTRVRGVAAQARDARLSPSRRRAEGRRCTRRRRAGPAWRSAPSGGHPLEVRHRLRRVRRRREARGTAPARDRDREAEARDQRHQAHHEREREAVRRWGCRRRRGCRRAGSRRAGRRRRRRASG